MIENPQSNEEQLKKTALDIDAPPDSDRQKQYERGTPIDVFANHEEFNEKHLNNDMANNDGSIVATLDNVFHWAEKSPEHKEDGSNVGEARAIEQDNSEVEEEFNALAKKPKE